MMRNTASQMFLGLIIFTMGEYGLAQKVTIITGQVLNDYDESLADAKVKPLSSSLSPVLTDEKGFFKIIALRSEKNLKIEFSHLNYQEKTISVILSKKDIQANIKLSFLGLEIRMTEFKSQAYIRGEIRGLKPNKYNRYKIVCYVLTDKWYIHPYAENKPRKGYALILEKGKFELGTVWRGYQAYKIGLLLVPISQYVPPAIPVGNGLPKSALLTAIQVEDYLITEAPPGI